MKQNELNELIQGFDEIIKKLEEDVLNVKNEFSCGVLNREIFIIKRTKEQYLKNFRMN